MWSTEVRRTVQSLAPRASASPVVPCVSTGRNIFFLSLSDNDASASFWHASALGGPRPLYVSPVPCPYVPQRLHNRHWGNCPHLVMGPGYGARHQSPEPRRTPDAHSSECPATQHARGRADKPVSTNL